MQDFMIFTEETVLIVDDESCVLEAISNMLSTQRYTVLTAESAEEALSILSSQQVDIIITDENMPGISGNELLNIVRHNYPGTIPMMMTGYADLQTTIRAINDGQVYKFFTKPVGMSDLIASVAKALEHQKCVKEVTQLKGKISEQKIYISKLENLYPGITQLKKDQSGAILIEE